MTVPNIDGVGVLVLGNSKSLQTYSGALVSVLNPSPEDIHVEDIVISLSKQCRYNGHIRKFYSVGEHTVRGVKLCKNKRLARSFLVHDFTEAYVGDLIRPVKFYNKEFKNIEAGFLRAILKKFSIYDYDEEGVHFIDNLMCAWEKRDLVVHQREWPGLPEVPKEFPVINPYTIAKTEKLLRQKIGELLNE